MALQISLIRAIFFYINKMKTNMNKFNAKKEVILHNHCSTFYINIPIYIYI